MKKTFVGILLLCLSFESAIAGLWDIGKSVKKEKASREKNMLKAKDSLEATKILVGEAEKKMLAAKKLLEEAESAIIKAQTTHEETKKFIATVDQEIIKNSSLIAEKEKIIANAEKNIREAQTFIEKEREKREQAILAKQTPERLLTEAKKKKSEDRYKQLAEIEKTVEIEKNNAATNKALYKEMVKAYEEKQAAYEHKKKLYNASIDACSKGLPCTSPIPPKI